MDSDITLEPGLEITIDGITSRIDLKTFIEKCFGIDKLILTGAPGSGKTTLMNHIASLIDDYEYVEVKYLPNPKDFFHSNILKSDAPVILIDGFEDFCFSIHELRDAISSIAFHDRPMRYSQNWCMA